MVTCILTLPTDTLQSGFLTLQHGYMYSYTSNRHITIGFPHSATWLHVFLHSNRHITIGFPHSATWLHVFLHFQQTHYNRVSSLCNMVTCILTLPTDTLQSGFLTRQHGYMYSYIPIDTLQSGFLTLQHGYMYSYTSNRPTLGIGNC